MNDCDQDNAMIGMVLLFLVVYQNTSGPVAWLYAAETTIDTGLGICVLALFGTVFIMSLICPVLMSTDSIGPSNTFFIFAGLSVLGAIYSATKIKETRGLSDKAKKLIFTPKRYLRRDEDDEAEEEEFGQQERGSDMVNINRSKNNKNE